MRHIKAPSKSPPVGETYEGLNNLEFKKMGKSNYYKLQKTPPPQGFREAFI
jgi:hypothetical protein